MNAKLQTYIATADMLAETFGQDCEVVLHDLSDPQRSVVYVANGSVTGREIGQQFDYLIKDVMLSERLQNGYVANYYFTAQNGKLIRSSTQLIFDEQQNAIGALCINIDTTPITQQIDYLNRSLPNWNVKSEPMADTEQSITAMIENLVDGILGNALSSRLSRDEKIEKVRFMEQKGIFLMKGSVELVAEKLGVNKVTIYSYLDEVRGKR